MRVMKNKATLLSVAVAGLFAVTAANATVSLTTGLTPVSYASEIVVTTAAPLQIASGVNTQATSVLGFGVSANQTTWMRFDLGGGAKWGTGGAVVANLTDTTTPGNIAAINVIVAQGGAVTDNFVVYQVTAGVSGIPFTDVISFQPPIAINSTAAPITMKYSLHGTAASAGNATSAPNSAVLYTSPTATLINVKTGNKWSFGAPTVEFVAATSSFKNFCPGALGVPGTSGCATPTDVDAVLGSIASYTFDGTVFDGTSTLLASNVTINGTGSKVTVTGDFSAAASVYIDTGLVGCNASPSAIVGTFTATTATFATSNTNGLPVPMWMCMKATGTTAIAAQSFTGLFVPTAVTTAGIPYAPIAYTSQPLGSFQRDGVELQAPWFTLGGTGSAYISRFFLTNTGNTDSLCTVSFLSETGNTVTVNTTPNAQGNSGAGVTVPAGKQVSVLATELVTSFSGNSRAAVRFSCPAPSANIQGRYIVTHSSGAVDSGTLLRPGTN